MSPVPLIAIVGALWSASLFPAEAMQDAQVEARDVETSTRRLAVEFLRAATSAIGSDPLTIESMGVALALAEEAMQLDPSDPEGWRTLLEISILAEREDLRERALRALGRLDPEDTRIRLRRMRDAVNRRQKVDRRLAAYAVLLDPANRTSLGGPVAARLALDLAMLHRRLGDLEAFGTWVRQATLLDPAFSEAAAMAAGFFSTRGEEVDVTARRLLALLLADITETAVQAKLGELLMEHGAYVGARRLYEMALTGMSVKGMPGSELVADLAIVQWAVGDDDAALTTIRRQQSRIDATYRGREREMQPRLSPLELARLHAPLSPTLATVRAVLMMGRGDAEASDAVDDMLEAFSAVLVEIDAAQDPEDAVRLRLQAAWVTLWLGADLEGVREQLKAVGEMRPLTEPAQRRFDGWIALREGDVDRARVLLEPLAAADDQAGVGLAVLLEAGGESRDAARRFLAVARGQPGTLLGIWSARQVTRLVGDALPLSETARTLEALIDEMRPTIDRYAKEPVLAFDVHVEFAQKQMGPYDPIVVVIEITNNSVLPLAIDEEGPIGSHLLLQPRLDVGIMNFASLPPLVVPIDRRLRLEPHDRLRLEVDLRRHWVGTVLDNHPLFGAFLKTRVISNFEGRVVSSGGAEAIIYDPGLLGMETTSRTARIDGVRLTEGWVERAIAAVEDPAAETDPALLSLLSHVVPHVDEDELAQDEDPGVDNLLRDDALAAIVGVFPRLSPVEQAWMLMVMRDDEALGPVHLMARESPSRLVRLAHLLRFAGMLGDPALLDDPVLLDAASDEDPVIRLVAAWIVQRLQHQVDAVQPEVVPPGTP